MADVVVVVAVAAAGEVAKVLDVAIDVVVAGCRCCCVEVACAPSLRLLLVFWPELSGCQEKNILEMVIGLNWAFFPYHAMIKTSKDFCRL